MKNRTVLFSGAEGADMLDQVKADSSPTMVDLHRKTAAAGEAAALDVKSAAMILAAAATQPPLIPVNVSNPLAVPYRTGSYLIYDVATSEVPDNFRSGLKLYPNPYRASGSHQLDYADFVRVFSSLPSPAQPGTLYLVDLREETHGFCNNRAVSWYADNDFSNVGHPLSWIVGEENFLMGFIERFQTVSIFKLEKHAPDNRDQQRVEPMGYWEVKVEGAKTEEELFNNLKIKNFTVQYVRIPVTDHCAPSDAALDALRTLANKVKPNDWVHFHCHGGDGRTTTFLAMYDMWCWKKAKYSGYLSREAFAARQYTLVPHYCLNPLGCPPSPPTTGWKLSLALARWNKLQQFHDDPLGD